MASKGSITLDDARLIHEFAIHVRPMIGQTCTALIRDSKTVERIAYCAIAEARYNARAERLRQTDLSDLYITEVIE